MPTFFRQPLDTISHSLVFLGPKELEQKRAISKDFDKLCKENILWDRFLHEDYRINSNEPDGAA